MPIVKLEKLKQNKDSKKGPGDSKRGALLQHIGHFLPFIGYQTEFYDKDYLKILKQICRNERAT